MNVFRRRLLGSVVACAAVLVAGMAVGTPSPGRAAEAPVARPAPPPELVVALDLGDPALQAGAIRGIDVVVARGFEVDLARVLARRLGSTRVRLVNVRPAGRRLAAGAISWHIALAALTRAEVNEAHATSIPYLPAGQAVVPRRGVEPPRSLAVLRTLQLCATRRSAGVATIASVVRPDQRPILAPGNDRLVQLLQTGACDAALVDGVAVGRVVAGRGQLLGRIAVRVDREPGLVVAVAAGSPIALRDIDRVLRRLRASGTLSALARRWLGIDPARLRPLVAVEPTEPPTTLPQ